MNFSDRPTLELLGAYDALLEELRARQIIRNSNPPAGGYAEYLSAKALNLKLEPNSNTGYDALGGDGLRYEIKARRITKYNPARQLSAIRNLDKLHFDFLIGVLFLSDFSIYRAALIPHRVVIERGIYKPHTNSTMFVLLDSVWDHEGVTDITSQLKSIQINVN